MMMMTMIEDFETLNELGKSQPFVSGNKYYIGFSQDEKFEAESALIDAKKFYKKTNGLCLKYDDVIFTGSAYFLVADAYKDYYIFGDDVENICKFIVSLVKKGVHFDFKNFNSIVKNAKGKTVLKDTEHACDLDDCDGERGSSNMVFSAYTLLMKRDIFKAKDFINIIENKYKKAIRLDYDYLVSGRFKEVFCKND